jgi:hypothetical protein
MGNLGHAYGYGTGEDAATTPSCNILELELANTARKTSNAVNVDPSQWVRHCPAPFQ